MKKIRISERQANILKNMGEDVPKNKSLKITEAQYNKILEMESMDLKTEDTIAGVKMPANKVPSKAVNNAFESGLDKGVKKDIGKLYEEFINELYGVNEGGASNTYESLIKLMEVAGLIENNKIKKEKFNNDKTRVKEVISHGLNEMMNGGSHYKVMETIENKLNEYGGYPAGAENDSSAPWNQPDMEPETDEEYLKPSEYPFEMLHYNEENDGFALFKKDGNLFVHIAMEHDGEILNDFCSDVNGIDAECINNYINYVATQGDLQIGLNPFKDILAIVRPENKDEILKYYGDDKKLVSILNGVDEVTTAASSGSFEAPLTMGSKFRSNVPEELDEVTTTTSVGGDSGTFAYDAPAGNNSDFWTKGNKLNKKMNENMVGQSEDRNKYTILMDMYKKANPNNKLVLKPKLMAAAKKLGISLDLSEDAQKDTQYPGGGFVDFDDCVKLNNNKVAQNGGCNQGDSGVVKVKGSSNSVVAKENVYEAIAKRTGKTVDEVKTIISKSK